MNIHQLVSDDLITLKQAVTIALVETGWPKTEAQRVASLLRTPEAAEKVKVTTNGENRKVRRQKRGNWTRWTDNERDTLRQLWLNGTSIKDIAERLNRNQTQITSALTRYGLYREHSRRPGVQKGSVTA